MDTINRNNLGDAVAQFLANGGAIEECAPATETKKAPSKKSREAPRASGVANTNPFDTPLSLLERSYEAEVRRCSERGFSLVQTVNHTKLPRPTVLRLCKEYDLPLRGKNPETPAQVAQALGELYARGIPHSLACERLGLDRKDASSIYAEYREQDLSLPKAPRINEASDGHIYSLILIGIQQGKTLATVIREQRLDADRAYRIYESHRRRTRRLLSDRRRKPHGKMAVNPQ